MQGVLLLNIVIKNIAAKTTLRLKESGELRHDHVGHDITLREKGCSILVQETDYLFPKPKFNKYLNLNLS